MNHFLSHDTSYELFHSLAAPIAEITYCNFLPVRLISTNCIWKVKCCLVTDFDRIFAVQFHKQNLNPIFALFALAKNVNDPLADPIKLICRLSNFYFEASLFITYRNN